MKPPAFAYAAPVSLEEALQLLTEDGARVLAGGQSLVPLMSARRAHPAALVDVNRVAELGELRLNGDVVAGAVVRADRLARDAALPPVLSEAAAHVGHPAVRNRGTLGGNLAFADPANNLPVVALALDAELTVRSMRGERTVAAAEFFRAAHTTALGPGELLCEVRFPALPDGAGSAYYEVAARSRGWGLASAAAVVELDGGVIAGARVALGGVGETPVRVDTSGLTGAEPGDEAFAAAAAAARAAVAEPRADVLASAEHRRHLAGVVVERALRAAAGRAR